MNKDFYSLGTVKPGIDNQEMLSNKTKTYCCWTSIANYYNLFCSMVCMLKFFKRYTIVWWNDKGWRICCVYCNIIFTAIRWIRLKYFVTRLQRKIKLFYKIIKQQIFKFIVFNSIHGKIKCLLVCLCSFQ